jgi:hypothetical protein
MLLKLYPPKYPPKARRCPPFTVSYARAGTNIKQGAQTIVLTGSPMMLLNSSVTPNQRTTP